MIHVEARLGDGLTEIVVSGHEGHAEGGRVCAAVSAITQTALLGLEQVAAHHPQHVTFTLHEE